MARLCTVSSSSASFSPTFAEIAGLSSYDFVVVDMEHGSGGISDALLAPRACRHFHHRDPSLARELRHLG